MLQYLYLESGICPNSPDALLSSANAIDMLLQEFLKLVIFCFIIYGICDVEVHIILSFI